MCKIALLSLMFIAQLVSADEWTSVDKTFGFSAPGQWKMDAQVEKPILVQFTGTDGVRGINVATIAIPKNFHLSKEGVAKSVEKLGGKLMTFSDNPEMGVPTLTYTWDLPGTGQFLVIMKLADTKAYKWQGFTDKKIVEDAEIAASGKTFHLIK